MEILLVYEYQIIYFEDISRYHFHPDKEIGLFDIQYPPYVLNLCT